MIKDPKGAERARGFAMLFSVLTSSLVLAIGLSIFNLTLKELTLSSSGRESQYAFYVSDTAAECALYWDLEAVTFSTPLAPRDPSIVPFCVGQNLIANSWAETTGTDSNGNDYTRTTFHLELADMDEINNGAYAGAEKGACSIVSVTKTDNAGSIETRIESLGYNIDDALDGECDTSTRDLLVERALRVRY